jgi:hypothetical protein
MSANAASRIVWAVAVTLGLGACGRSAPDQAASATPARAVAVKPVIAQPVPTRAAKASIASVTQDSESTRAAPSPWLAELLNDPDPQVRLQGLDAWKRHPGETLDAVTYALVDPDESVRARAQELFERELARR